MNKAGITSLCPLPHLSTLTAKFLNPFQKLNPKNIIPKVKLSLPSSRSSYPHFIRVNPH
jgi:hypothetical protein